MLIATVVLLCLIMVGVVCECIWLRADLNAEISKRSAEGDESVDAPFMEVPISLQETKGRLDDLQHKHEVLVRSLGLEPYGKVEDCYFKSSSLSDGRVDKYSVDCSGILDKQERRLRDIKNPLFTLLDYLKLQYVPPQKEVTLAAKIIKKK